MSEGIKTTEFWVSIAPAIMAYVQKDNVELSKYLLICATILGVAYITSRTWVKCKHVNQ